MKFLGMRGDQFVLSYGDDGAVLLISRAQAMTLLAELAKAMSEAGETTGGLPCAGGPR